MFKWLSKVVCKVKEVMRPVFEILEHVRYAVSLVADIKQKLRIIAC